MRIFFYGSHALMCIRRYQDVSNKKEILNIKKSWKIYLNLIRFILRFFLDVET